MKLSLQLISIIDRSGFVYLQTSRYN